MEHNLEELDECIFDYLSSNADNVISIDNIYRDITSDEGHRCPDLRYQDASLFIDHCFGLDKKFSRVKCFLNEGRMFLLFSKKNVVEDSFRKIDTCVCFSSDQILSSVLKSKSTKFNGVLDLVLHSHDLNSFNKFLEMYQPGYKKEIVNKLIDTANLRMFEIYFEYINKVNKELRYKSYKYKGIVALLSMLNLVSLYKIFY